MSAIARNDQEYYARRYSQLQQALMPFRLQLQWIYERMPVRIKMDVATGEVSQDTDPEWQVHIDRVKKDMEDYVRDNYPEFLDPKTHLK
jgi:hypothetical protein